jgi:5-methylcytosine-specific restriction enzyme A
MPKLSRLKPSLSSAPLRVGPAPKDEQQRSRQRDNTQPWRAWFKTARWAKLRLFVFKRDLFTCQEQTCGKIEAKTSLLVAHHKRPHRGNPLLFWDTENLTTVCKDCHDGPIQARERREHIEGDWS